MQCDMIMSPASHRSDHFLDNPSNSKSNNNNNNNENNHNENTYDGNNEKTTENISMSGSSNNNNNIDDKNNNSGNYIESGSLRAVGNKKKFASKKTLPPRLDVKNLRSKIANPLALPMTSRRPAAEPGSARLVKFSNPAMNNSAPMTSRSRNSSGGSAQFSYTGEENCTLTPTSPHSGTFLINYKDFNASPLMHHTRISSEEETANTFAMNSPRMESKRAFNPDLPLYNCEDNESINATPTSTTRFTAPTPDNAQIEIHRKAETPAFILRKFAFTARVSERNESFSSYGCAGKKGSYEDRICNLPYPPLTENRNTFRVIDSNQSYSSIDSVASSNYDSSSNLESLYLKPVGGVFGVLDGHAGDVAADIIADLVRTHFYNKLQSTSSWNWTQDHLLELLNVSETDYLKLLSGEAPSVNTKYSFSKKPDRYCGTTALFVIIPPTEAALSSLSSHISLNLVIANIGDCRAVVVETDPDGTHETLTTDCNVKSNLSEISRIEKLGGFILQNRVQGVLAVTRALGHMALKPYIISTPDISILSISSSDPQKLLVLASDGVWNTLDGAKVASIVRNHSDNTFMAAKAIVEESIKEGSLDDTTATVIDLKKLCFSTPFS